MDGLDWIGDSSEEWPEGWTDVAKGVLMPHTLVGKVLDRGRGGKVVTHTQPPPIAQNAREVQGQLTGLLRTVKGVEEKLDDTTRQLALLQRASVGSQEADLFRQTLTTAVLGMITAYQWGRGSKALAVAHGIPILQSLNGARASFSKHPFSTVLWPLSAAVVGNFGWAKEQIESKSASQTKPQNLGLSESQRPPEPPFADKR
jgi:hypothetical protein